MALNPVTALIDFEGMRMTLDDLQARPQVLSYVIDEGISKPFTLEVRVAVVAPQHIELRSLLHAAAWLRQPVVFKLRRGDHHERLWACEVTSCSVSEATDANALQLFLTLMHPLQRLSQHLGNEVYLNHSVLGLAMRLMGEAVGTGDVSLCELDHIEGLHAPLELQVRHQQSKLDFLHKLLEAYGLSYWLETCASSARAEDDAQGRPGRILLFTRPEGLLQRLDPVPMMLEVPLGRHHGLDNEGISHLSACASIVPSGARIDALDATAPAAMTAGAVDAQPVMGTWQALVSDARYRFNGTSFDGSNAEHRAQVMAQQLRSQAVSGTYAVGNVLRAQPGMALEIEGHETMFWVVAAAHSGTDGSMHASSHADSPEGQPESYACTLQLLPIDRYASQPGSIIPWLGRRCSTPSMPMGLLSATVLDRDGSIGSAGPYVDDAGRVLLMLQGVQHTVPEDAPCIAGFFARVSHLWAGQGRGAFFWPTPGSEVMVGFVGDDGAEPVVLGAAYNAENRPAHTYAMAERSGIRSNKKGNELSFFEAPGREELKLAALHTLKIEANDLMTTRVGYKHFFAAAEALLQKWPKVPQHTSSSDVVDLYRDGRRAMSSVVGHAKQLVTDGSPKNCQSRQDFNKSASLWRKYQDKFDEQLHHLPPADRQIYKRISGTLNTVVSVAAHASRLCQDALVSRTDIFGHAQSTITGDARIEVRKTLRARVAQTIEASCKQLLLHVTKKLAVQASEACIRLHAGLRIEQHHQPSDTSCSLTFAPNHATLHGRKVDVAADAALTLRQGGCTITLKGGEAKIFAPKVLLRGDDIELQGRKSITLKSPSTRIY